MISDDLDDCENTTVLSESIRMLMMIVTVLNFLDVVSNPNESIDTDGDSIGDNSDAFPLNANETTDTDNDGVGDNTNQCPNGEVKNNGLVVQW